MNQQEFRALRKKAGVCRDCGREDAYTMAGRTYCAECAEKDRHRKEMARKDPEKRERMLTQNRKKVARHKAAGICPCCGKRPTYPGKTLCGTKRHNLEHPAKIFVSSAAFVELVKTEGSGLTAFANGSYKIFGVPVVVFDSDDPLEIYLSDGEET